jgi:hypothetical protein
MTATRSAITKQRRWRRSGQGVRFSFSGYSLRLRKPKRETSSRVKNRHRSLSRIYKGPGETRSTLRPNPPRNSKLKGETLVPRTARARTTAAPRTTRPVALTLQQDMRHLWQAKQATLHLRHNDCVKKRCATSFDFVSFSSSPFSLFLQGPGKGILQKGSFSTKEAGLEPSY